MMVYKIHVRLVILLVKHAMDHFTQIVDHVGMGQYYNQIYILIQVELVLIHAVKDIGIMVLHAALVIRAV